MQQAQAAQQEVHAQAVQVAQQVVQAAQAAQAQSQSGQVPQLAPLDQKPDVKPPLPQGSSQSPSGGASAPTTLTNS